MEAAYITISIIAAIALVLPYLLFLVFPSRREAIGRSAWFAFAPLVVGVCGMVAIAIFVLTAGNKITPAASAGLAGSAMLTTFNLLNGYRSVTAWWRNHRQG